MTGSLIDRKQIDTPSPISVVTRDQLVNSGATNIGDVLQQLPSQGNALNAQNNNGGDGSTRIDLRSLGDQRTLVLLDGRRVVPSGLGADASVDLGTIPLAMVERVEVLKDSSAATYGSDAIAGVVNIITRQDFNGTEATIYAATSQHGDGTNYDLSFVSGHSSKKGNITFSAGYQKQDPVFASARGSWASNFDVYNFAGQAQGQCGVPGAPVNGPNGAFSGPGSPCANLAGSTSTPNGYLDTTNPGATTGAVNVPGCNFGPGTMAGTGACTYNPATGTWRPFVNGTPNSFGDTYNFQPVNYLYTPSQRFNVFGQGHYDITKNTSVFFQASFNNRTSTQQLAAEPISPADDGPYTVSEFNLYNPFGAFGQYGADQPNGVGSDLTDYRRRLVEFGPRVQEQNINTSRIVAGLQGKVDEDAPVFKNWKWELSYNYGRVDATGTNTGDLILSHLQNALGPSMVINGTPECVSTPGNAMTVIPGCVPLNLFQPGTPGAVNQAMINYLTFTGIQAGFNEQHSALAQAHGKIVDLPNNGDISMAIGADYRHEQGGSQPDPLTATGDTTGNAFAPTEGSYHAFEGFAELSIVPISHVKGAEWVEVDVAGRAYDYNIKDASGNDASGVTGKVSAIWRTEAGLAARGTYGTSFRAPAIGELYSGQAQDFVAIQDPCDVNPPSGPAPIQAGSVRAKECQAQIGANYLTFNPNTSQQVFEIGGNPHLTPETAVSGTVGGVWEPGVIIPALKGLAFNVDYWNINISNAITAIPAQTVFANCYSGGQQSFCNDIIRSPGTNFILKVNDLEANVGSIVTSGMDYAASYNHKIPSGSFRVSAEVDQLFMYNENTGGVNPANPSQDLVLHGRNFYDLGVLPEWRGVGFFEYQNKTGFGIGFDVRYLGNFYECNNDNCNNAGVSGATVSNERRAVGDYWDPDVFADYAFKTGLGQTRIEVGIKNVFDVQPNLVYNGAALNSDESAYDFMGRYYWARLSHLF